jgi:very-short-patch-repair endonuclease
MEDAVQDETLVEMAYRWADIETSIEAWARNIGKENEYAVGKVVAPALTHAFRVEAKLVDDGLDINGDYWARYGYEVLFDVENPDARQAAKVVRDETGLVEKVIADAFSNRSRVGSHRLNVRVISIGVPAEGQVCGRPWEPPPKPHLDVSDVPIEKPDSNVPLTKRDGYWLTPIEVPFYDALRETGLVFAVQPWVQGVKSRYRLDFLIFYDGGVVAVELDGHESHKTKEQRQRDAARQRWFAERKVQTLRWTGSEVIRNPQECVRQLLEIARGRQARP